MENIYEELQLDNNLSVEEINNQLVQLERVWHQRELTQPEKAREMLVLIDKAKGYFTDESSKATYDRSLFEVGNESTNDSQISFEKWFSKAKNFYESKEYDIAKTAIEKALSYYDDETDNLEFIYEVACIYRENNDYERALQYLNKAIVIAPNAWFLYKDKGFLCEDQIICFKKALEIIDKDISERGETDYLRKSKSQMLGLIARYYLNVLGDYYSAERLANAAIECGDAYGMGSAVLEDMKKPFPVGYQSLLSYENEKSNIVEEIPRLVAQIINNNQLYKDDLAGWILTKKRCKCTNPDDPHTTEYAYVLCVDGSFRRFESEYSEHNEEYEKPGSTLSFDSAVLLQEFDYSGYFNSTYNSGDAIHIIKSTLAWDQTHTNKSSVTLNRLCYKGAGLYNALKEIVDKDKHPIIIDRPRPEEYRAKMASWEQEKKNGWMRSGKCQYCGGEFRGLFVKKCSSCGRTKDY